MSEIKVNNIQSLSGTNGPEISGTVEMNSTGAMSLPRGDTAYRGGRGRGVFGGGYGQSSEKLMMKEILRNGPLNTEFQAPTIFSTYRSGLVTQDGFTALREMTENVEGASASDVTNKNL